MVTEPDWTVLVVNFVDDPKATRRLSEINLEEQPSSPQTLSEQLAPPVTNLPTTNDTSISGDALRRVELHADTNAEASTAAVLRTKQYVRRRRRRTSACSLPVASRADSCGLAPPPMNNPGQVTFASAARPDPPAAVRSSETTCQRWVGGRQPLQRAAQKRKKWSAWTQAAAEESGLNCAGIRTSQRKTGVSRDHVALAEFPV